MWGINDIRKNMLTNDCKSSLFTLKKKTTSPLKQKG